MWNDRQDDHRIGLRTLRPLLVAAAGVIALSALLGAEGDCVCATARETNAWCPVHKLGYVGGVKITSEAAFITADAHGHDLDLSLFTCPTCLKAIASNGFCETDRIGFVNKKAYFSRLTYELGRAEVPRAASITCPTCRKNSETHGWCAKSHVGMVGPFAIKDRESFDRAVAGLAILVAADQAAPRCQHCVVAILTSSECPVCRIRYKDGKAVSSATAPAAARTSR